jgi:Family of unknown function (DUF5681)
MSKTEREYAAHYRTPVHTRFKKGQSGNPRGRPAKNLPAQLAAALNEKVTVTENSKRRQVTKREAVIAQLVNKSASAELRATKMLIDMLRNIEKRAAPAMAEKNPFSPTDKEVVQQLITRLRRDMCAGCPWALQRGRIKNTGETHVCPALDLCAISAGCSQVAKLSLIVMPGFIPGIHVPATALSRANIAWITGTSPVMTTMIGTRRMDA